MPIDPSLPRPGQGPQAPTGPTSPMGPYIRNMNPDARRAMALREGGRLYEMSRQQMWARRQRMIDWLLAWHGVVTMQHGVQRSQIAHDITRESIERILPKMLGTDLQFEYYKAGAYAEPPSALANFYADAMHYFTEKLQVERDKLIYGRGIGKWRWEKLERMRQRGLRPREIEAFTQLGITDFPAKIKERVIEYDGPRFHAVDPFAMTYDSSVSNPYRQGWTFEEFYETARALVLNANFDQNAVRAYLSTDNKHYGDVQRWRLEIVARIGIDINTSWGFGEPSGWPLYEGYFPFDLDGDGHDEPILLVCDPSFQYPIRVEANPYDHGIGPYSFSDWMRVTGEFWPVGVAEMLEPTQTLVNVWSNLAIDNIVLSVFCVWLRHRDSRIAGNTLRIVPNQLITTDMMEGLHPLRPPDSTPQIQSWLKFYLQRAQELSGITAFSALGTPELGQTKTALGIQTLKAAAEEFLSFAKRLMIEDSMDYDARFLLELLKQFVTRDLDITIRGKDGLAQPFVVQPEDLDGDFTWKVIVEHKNPLSRELERQEFENWVAKSLKLGAPMNIPLIVMELAQRADISNPQRFLMMPQAPPGGMPGMQGGAPGAPPPAMGMLQQAMQSAQGGGLEGPGAGANFKGGPQPAGGPLMLAAGEAPK